MHRLLLQQIAKAKDADGKIDFDLFSSLVSDAYEESDRERRRTDHSISLMVEEIDTINHNLEDLVAERTSDLRQREAELKAQNLMFDAAISNMLQGLSMFDRDMRLVMHNRRYVEMYRLSPEELAPGMPFRDVLDLHVKTGDFRTDPDAYIRELAELIANDRTATHSIDLANGRTHTVAIAPMANGGWLATHEDITERKAAENRIAHMARHDELTGLPNRLLLGERLNEALASVKEGQQLAVLCLDLDEFKTVNDTLGHPIGDELLRQVSERLRGCVRETDTISRMGGDEFLIVQTDIAGPADTEQLAARILKTIGMPYDIGGQAVRTNTSIGIARAPEHGNDSQQLLKKADMALYAAKAGGRGIFRCFEPEMGARIETRRALEGSLRTALERGEFVLHYQPIVNLKQNRVKSCEALLRWCHPERGLVSPAEFIPVAEQMGLIVALGEWVIRQACQDAAAWPSDVAVAVNLSPTQLSSRNLLPTVLNVLASSGLPAHRLELEITEEVLMHNTENTLKTLHQLRSLGVSTSLDDFGTGYSSLSYLSSFPFDAIKIDRCFIKALEDNQQAATTIVGAITGLAKNLRMTTTAEGIETQFQLDQARELGCTDIQGYFYSKPVPASELVSLFGNAPVSWARTAAA